MSKVITIGNSIGTVFPKSVVEEHGFAPGQEVDFISERPGRLVIERKSNGSKNKRSADLIKWAISYVEKYRKDFEALAGK